VVAALSLKHVDLRPHWSLWLPYWLLGDGHKLVICSWTIQSAHTSLHVSKDVNKVSCRGLA